MPSYIEEPEAAACKWVSIREDNAQVRAAGGLLDPRSTRTRRPGFPLAICDGSYHTLMRTGASAAVSAKWLARKDSKVLAILGTGSVGRGHARDLRRGLRVGGRAHLEPHAGVGRPLPRGARRRSTRTCASPARPTSSTAVARRGRDRHRHARARSWIVDDAWVEARRAHRGARRRPEGRAGARPAHPAAGARLRRRHPPVPRGRRDQRRARARA